MVTFAARAIQDIDSDANTIWAEASSVLASAQIVFASESMSWIARAANVTMAPPLASDTPRGRGRLHGTVQGGIRLVEGLQAASQKRHRRARLRVTTNCAVCARLRLAPHARAGPQG